MSEVAKFNLCLKVLMGSRNRNDIHYRNPCLTMHQPWASLLVYGIKRIEGRSWPAPIRGTSIGPLFSSSWFSFDFLSVFEVEVLFISWLDGKSSILFSFPQMNCEFFHRKFSHSLADFRVNGLLYNCYFLVGEAYDYDIRTFS